MEEEEDGRSVSSDLNSSDDEGIEDQGGGGGEGGFRDGNWHLLEGLEGEGGSREVIGGERENGEGNEEGEEEEEEEEEKEEDKKGNEEKQQQKPNLNICLICEEDFSRNPPVKCLMFRGYRETYMGFRKWLKTVRDKRDEEEVDVPQCRIVEVFFEDCGVVEARGSGNTSWDDGARFPCCENCTGAMIAFLNDMDKYKEKLGEPLSKFVRTAFHNRRRNILRVKGNRNKFRKVEQEPEPEPTVEVEPEEMDEDLGFDRRIGQIVDGFLGESKKDEDESFMEVEVEEEREENQADYERQQEENRLQSMVDRIVKEVQQRERERASRRLPDEIWEMILCKLTELDDMRSVLNTTTEWKSAMRSRRSHYLFANVFPYIVEYLSKKETLACRKVCLSWRQGVDEFLERAPHLAPYSPGTSNRRMLRAAENMWRQHPFPLMPHRFPDDEDIAIHQRLHQQRRQHFAIPYVIDGTEERQAYWNGSWLIEPNPEENDGGTWHEGFYEALANHSRNPYLGRALKIKEELHIEAIGSVPFRFRQYIWYLDLSYTNQVSYISILSHVCNCVSFFPNLRQLRISANTIFICDAYTTLKGQGLLKLELPQPLRDTHLPLETLQLDFNYGESYPDFGIETMLLRRFSRQLGRLEVNHWNYNEWSLLPFPKLKELRIHTSLRRSVKTLKGLHHTHAPLLKLVLQVDLTPKECQTVKNLPCCRTLCLQLKHFKQLDFLGVTINGVGPFADTSGKFFNDFVNIPFAKPASFRSIRRVEINHRPVNRRFLLHFPNLTDLKIRLKGSLGNSTLMGESFLLPGNPMNEVKMANLGVEALRRVSSHGAKIDFESNLYEMFGLFPHLEEVRIKGGPQNRVDLHTKAYFIEGREYLFNKYFISDVESPALFFTFRRITFSDLSALSIHFSGRKYESKHRLELCRILNKLEDTLKILKISCADAQTAHQILGRTSGIPKDELVRIPSVKCLQLNHIPVPKPFLKRFPCLERLRLFPESRTMMTVEVNRRGPSCSREPLADALMYPRTKDNQSLDKFKVVTGEKMNLSQGEIYGSNIWEFLPSLEGIKFMNATYTRHGYQKNRNEPSTSSTGAKKY